MGPLPRRREGCWQIKRPLEFTQHLAPYTYHLVLFVPHKTLWRECTLFITVSILLTEKMRFREMKQLKQGHIASK